MAILDRPMFQRPLTKDQLRMYGIPAFANGGIVGYAEAGEVEVIDEEIITKPNGDIVRVKTIRQKTPRGFVTRKIEEVLDPATLTQESKNPRIKDDKKDNKVGGQSTLRLASEMEAGAENVAKSARSTEEVVSDTVDRRQEELAESGFASTGGERNRLTDLEALVKERSDLYKKILGDPREGLKQQGLLQLAQFGLNLASARGGNLAEKIAKSAKDPLQTFAALGRESMKDERAIDMIAIKGAEEELGRTQKPGNFGQLVNDLMNANKDLAIEDAYAKAIEIFAQKSGKSPSEQKEEYYNKLVELYTANLADVDEAIAKATAATEARFSSGQTTTTTTATEEPITDLR